MFRILSRFDFGPFLPRDLVFGEISVTGCATLSEISCGTKKIGQNLTVQVDCRNFCVSCGFAGGATLNCLNHLRWRYLQIRTVEFRPIFFAPDEITMKFRMANGATLNLALTNFQFWRAVFPLKNVLFLCYQAQCEALTTPFCALPLGLNGA